jgi:hypothetical protein
MTLLLCPGCGKPLDVSNFAKLAITSGFCSGKAVSYGICHACLDRLYADILKMVVR